MRIFFSQFLKTILIFQPDEKNGIEKASVFLEIWFFHYFHRFYYGGPHAMYMRHWGKNKISMFFNFESPKQSAKFFSRTRRYCRRFVDVCLPNISLKRYFSENHMIFSTPHHSEKASIFAFFDPLVLVTYNTLRLKLYRST